MSIKADNTDAEASLRDLITMLLVEARITNRHLEEMTDAENEHLRPEEEDEME